MTQPTSTLDKTKATYSQVPFTGPWYLFTNKHLGNDDIEVTVLWLYSFLQCVSNNGHAWRGDSPDINLLAPSIPEEMSYSQHLSKQ